MNINDLIASFPADQSDLTTKSSHFANSFRARKGVSGKNFFDIGTLISGIAETDGEVIRAGRR